jgi:hypothetical protein
MKAIHDEMLKWMRGVAAAAGISHATQSPKPAAIHNY